MNETLILWLSAASSLLVLAGVALLLARDARRRSEMARLRAALVGGVTHDLKTPLTLIRLYAETLLHGDELAEDERKNYYRIITRESARLSHLIDKVLEFSSIEQGQRRYRFEPGDLAEVVAETVETYGEFLRFQGFEVETHLDPELPTLSFDGDAIAEAVVNLLENAAKYSGATKSIVVRLFREKTEAVLEVEDRGLGISEPDRERIFLKFFRASAGSDKGGYGLGLYIVQHAIHAHGGRIEVGGRPGEGSRFRIFLPLAAPSPDGSRKDGRQADLADARDRRTGGA